MIGDGKSTIAELIDIINSDPRRGIGHEKVLTRLEINSQAKRLMVDAGYDEKTVLKKDEQFFLCATANLSTGGTAIDLTDVVHPDNREMAIRAVRAVGLDIGGVDFLTDDITHSYKGRRWRHRRNQCRPWLPHARGAERGRAARCRRQGARYALPTRCAGSNTGCRGDWH